MLLKDTVKPTADRLQIKDIRQILKLGSEGWPEAVHPPSRLGLGGWVCSLGEDPSHVQETEVAGQQVLSAQGRDFQLSSPVVA